MTPACPSPHPTAGASFATLVRGLDSTLRRETVGLRSYEAVAEEPVSARLGDGLAYALDEVRETVGLSREARDLLAALVPFEAQVRALLASGSLVSAEVSA